MDSPELYAHPAGSFILSPAHRVAGVSGYNGATNIQDWMAASAITAPPDSRLMNAVDLNMCSGDISQSVHAFHHPGSIPVSRINSQSSGGFDAPLSGPNTNEPDGTIPYDVQELSSLQPVDPFSLDHGSEHEYAVHLNSESQDPMDMEPHMGHLRIASSVGENVPGSASASNGISSSVMPYAQEWTSVQESRTVPIDASEQAQVTAWGYMCTDPSSSSSQSSHPDTPLSVAISDEPWWMDENARMPPPMVFRPQNSMIAPGFYLDGERFVGFPSNLRLEI